MCRHVNGGVSLLARARGLIIRICGCPRLLLALTSSGAFSPSGCLGNAAECASDRRRSEAHGQIFQGLCLSSHHKPRADCLVSAWNVTCEAEVHADAEKGLS